MRICVVTPPGMKGGEDNSNDLEEQGDNVALMLEQHLKIAEEQGQEGVGPAIQCISVGDLIQKEITKKSDFGKRIYESRKKYSYIEDEIVIELVKQHIDLCEKDRQNYKGWILEGFPRTRLQAIALQQWKIIPDKFFMLNIADNVAFENLKRKLIQGGRDSAQYNNETELNVIAQNAVTEYRVNIKGVKEQFMGRIYEIDGNKSKRMIVEDMARIGNLKDSNAPRKPPKIIMMGPPGVDIQHHAKQISAKYKLIYIDVNQMVKDCVRREGDNANELRQKIKEGYPIQDEIIMKLLRQRLYM